MNAKNERRPSNWIACRRQSTARVKRDSFNRMDATDESKAIPIAYSFNVKTPSQLIDLMTDQGRFSCHSRPRSMSVFRRLSSIGAWSQPNGEHTFHHIDSSTTRGAIRDSADRWYLVHRASRAARFVSFFEKRRSPVGECQCPILSSISYRTRLRLFIKQWSQINWTLETSLSWCFTRHLHFFCGWRGIQVCSVSQKINLPRRVYLCIVDTFLKHHASLWQSSRDGACINAKAYLLQTRSYADISL